jgi:rare lipoprotein A
MITSRAARTAPPQSRKFLRKPPRAPDRRLVRVPADCAGKEFAVTRTRSHHRIALSIAIAAWLGFAAPPIAASSDQGGSGRTAAGKKQLDRSGQKRVGKASYYHRKFAGRKMANGKRMDPQHDNAASKTLPLGTTAKVTNLETGRSTVVTIEDRGPYVPGRIVDLSPSSADQIGLTREEGIAPVAVAPIAVPMPDGSVKPGAGAIGGSGSAADRSGASPSPGGRTGARPGRGP